MTSPDSARLTAHISELATARHLAVVSDFDGTLAGFAKDIYGVTADPKALRALQGLAALPHTTVAVLSGRHLEGLRRVCPLEPPVLFGGSHGAESSWEDSPLTPEMRDHLARKEAQIREVMQRFPGAEIEVKPFQRVLHLRRLETEDPARAAAAYAAGLEIPADGFPRTAGKSVIEFSATAATKGSWINLLRERVGATATVFVGDDVTDEDGFAALTLPADRGVKVGPGETRASLRLGSVSEVGKFFAELLAARQARVLG